MNRQARGSGPCGFASYFENVRAFAFKFQRSFDRALRLEVLAAMPKMNRV